MRWHSTTGPCHRHGSLPCRMSVDAYSPMFRCVLCKRCCRCGAGFGTTRLGRGPQLRASDPLQHLVVRLCAHDRCGQKWSARAHTPTTPACHTVTICGAGRILGDGPGRSPLIEDPYGYVPAEGGLLCDWSQVEEAQSDPAVLRLAIDTSQVSRVFQARPTHALHVELSALHDLAAFFVADRERFTLRAPGHACRPSRAHAQRHACSASGSVSSLHAAWTAREHTSRCTDMEPERSRPTGEHCAGDLCAVACTLAGICCLLYVACRFRARLVTVVCRLLHAACCIHAAHLTTLRGALCRGGVLTLAALAHGAAVAAAVTA